MHASRLSKWRTAIGLFAAVSTLTVLLFSGCDPTVDVFRPNDQFRYSLYGALDVAADTQAIRVSPIDDSLGIGAPRTLNATVLLENLDTGEQISLTDFPTTVGGEDALVHNFWTTFSIDPSTSYRITVQEEGEPVTTVSTTTPTQAPSLSHDNGFLLPCLFPNSPSNQRKPPNTFVVTAQGVDRIAVADVIYPISFGSFQTRRKFSHYGGIEQEGDFFRIPVFYRPDLVNLNPSPPPGPRKECAGFGDFTNPHAFVAVASGGPDWPEEWRGVPFSQIASPDTFSNVQGGHGYVGGIYSDTIKVPLRAR